MQVSPIRMGQVFHLHKVGWAAWLTVIATINNCQSYPFAAQCPAKPLKRRPKRVLRFSKQQQHVTRRRQLAAQARENGQNLRAAVESTVRSLKHPFRNGKVPVRGQPRVSMLLIGSAAMSNVRRICRYWKTKNKLESQKKSRKSSVDTPIFNFLNFTSHFFSIFLAFSPYRTAEIDFSN